MCRCLRASLSGYYGWVTRVPSVRTQENAQLLARIQTLHAEQHGGLFDESMSGAQVDCASRADGVMAAIRPHPGHSGFGSGLSVYLRGVPAVAGGTSHNLQHERSG